MEVMVARGAGLDVAKKSVVACVLAGEPGTLVVPEVKTFGTMTVDLERLAAWLAERGVTDILMEATGSYWQPSYNVLERHGGFRLVVGNAEHLKAVPGRKTDVKDAVWLAQLLRHGLVRPSFIPDQEQRELRELTRYRTALIRERASEVNRLQKTLETATIKLAAVATAVLGKSGRESLLQLVAGSTDAAALAELARGKLRAKLPDLQRALTGRRRPHHRFLRAELLAMIDLLDERIDAVSAESTERERPFADDLARLDTIPGVGQRVAEILVAERGPDRAQFRTPAQLASWAGLCPGNHESGGKRLKGKPRSGNAAIRRALVEAARAAARTRTDLRAQDYRLKHRRRSQRAAVAVAHSIIRSIFVVLTRKSPYLDLGPDFFERRKPDDTEQQLVRKLERLGNTVTIEKVA